MAVAALPVRPRPLAVRGWMSTAALALLMVVATAWSVLSSGWTDPYPSVLLVGVAAVLEGALLARSSCSRLLALFAAPVLLLLTLLPESVGTRPGVSGTGPGSVVAQYASAATTGLLGNAQWEFNVGLAALLWVVGFWAAWFALRERRGSLATGPCWAVLAVDVINAPAGGRASFPATIAAASAVLLIAAVHLDNLSAGWRRRGVRVLPGTDGRFAAATAAGGAVILLLALLAPPVTSTDISARLFGLGGHGPGRGSGPGFAPARVAFNTATIPGGKLTLSNTPVLTYRTQSNATAYLRMATDSIFRAGEWLPDTSANNRDLVSIPTLPGQIDRDRSLADGGVGTSLTTLSATILMSADSSGNDLVPFAGEPESSPVSGRVTGVSPGGSIDGLLTVDQVSANRPLVGAPLTTVATVSVATPDELRSAGTSYPGFLASDGFLSLPGDATNGKATINQLALQWTANATNPYDEATAIENHLRNPQNFTYSLDPPLPTDSTWPVVYFLTQSKSGYCQYFASAMGAMMRSVGIPARVVNGYGPGSSPEAAGHGNNVLTHTVSSNDAHSWVEAYFPGYGWIPFEPTPPSQLGDYQTFQRGAAAAQPSSPATPTATATPTPAPTRTPTSTAEASAPVTETNGGPTLPAALAGGTLGAIGLVVLVIASTTWFLRPRGIRGVWRRVALIGRVLGIRRVPSMTFGEYARSLSEAIPPDTTRVGHRRGGGMPVGTPLRRRVAEALAEIAAVSDASTYSAGPAHPREAVRLRRAWRRIARVSPRLGWRAYLNRSASPP